MKKRGTLGWFMKPGGENWISLTRCSVVSCYHYWVTKIMKKSYELWRKWKKTTDVNSYQCHCLMPGDQVPNIVMFVVIIAERLGISAQTVSKEGGNHADVRLRLLPKLRTIINNIC